MAKTSLHQNSIAAALAAKHADDLFIAQCKTGPTQQAEAGGVQQMDAWAMAKSWAHPCATAYEIKVTRGDFLADRKWRGYLPYCNEFYFACPWKLISPDELPGDECGLVWVQENGMRAIVKRRAKYREVEIPDTLWRYILMWRVKVQRDHGVSSEDNVARVKALIAENADMQAVGKHFAHKIARHVQDVEWENQRLQGENKKLETVKLMLKELGFETPSQLHEWSVRPDVMAALAAMPAVWGRLCEEAKTFSKIFAGVEARMAEILKIEPVNKPGMHSTEEGP